MKFVMSFAAVLVVGAAFFLGGYQYAAEVYGKDIAELREDYATRSQALEVKYREKEREQYNSLMLAWEERDKALARVNDLSSDVDRVRKQADAYRRRLSESSSDSCQPCKVELARCAGLLERGAEVAGRCADVVQRIAVDKDSIANVVNK